MFRIRACLTLQRTNRWTVNLEPTQVEIRQRPAGHRGGLREHRTEDAEAHRPLFEWDAREGASRAEGQSNLYVMVCIFALSGIFAGSRSDRMPHGGMYNETVLPASLFGRVLMSALRRVPLLAALAAALAPALTLGQSFNIDLDIFFGPPSGGNGAPSPAFGAAANQPGNWNRVSATGPTTPIALLDLAGKATSAIMQASGSTGDAVGFNNPQNTGDYALLQNDFADIISIGHEIVYTFRDMTNGTYLVYTYASIPSGGFNRNEVSVAGALPPNPLVVTGPMPANQFGLLLTHSVHEVRVTDGLLQLSVREVDAMGAVNGFQLVLVPEPSGVICLGVLASIGLAYRRKRL